MRRWDQEGITVKVLHTRISYLRTFARWIGKDGMVKDIRDYLPGRDLTRRAAAKVNRSWQAHGVDPLEVIARAREMDERLALALSIEHAFGLRMKEAIEMRPARCLAESGQVLEIYEGTKGGRLRRITIDSDYKREVFEWARRLAAGSREGRVRWPGKTWKQARRHYYYLLEKLGVTQADLGVTSHGLRHGYSQDKYADLTGLPPPISGVDPKLVDPDVHRDASIQVSRDLGHGRTQVTASYYGSHGHALRKKD
jgi:integrase